MAHLDLDGDFLIDALYTGCDYDPGPCYWEVLFDVPSGGALYQWLSPTPPGGSPISAGFLDFPSSEVVTVDLNGDSRPDRLWCVGGSERFLRGVVQRRGGVLAGTGSLGQCLLSSRDWAGTTSTATGSSTR
ncbi:MAG: hypothetical protein KatS3mg076_0100 [Candidatus Binatia bacterium]|nr:MAG: hypothetical protein KatS3mg076_0100 [Candidatus Binatia bacterium]